MPRNVDGGSGSWARRRWRPLLSALAGVLFVLRVVVFLVQSDHHTSPSVAATFPTDGPYSPPGIPSDVVTALPSLDPLSPPTDIPSDAPVAVSLGPVTYEVTGAAPASLVEYSNADLVLVHVSHPSLPYRKTIDSGVGDYFTVYATAGTSRSITCRILAHHGTVEVARTAHGADAQVHCDWQAPST